MEVDFFALVHDLDPEQQRFQRNSEYFRDRLTQEVMFEPAEENIRICDLKYDLKMCQSSPVRGVKVYRYSWHDTSGSSFPLHSVCSGDPTHFQALHVLV